MNENKTPAAAAALYRHIVEESKIAVMAAEKKTRRVLMANRRWRELEGIALDRDITGVPLHELLPEERFFLTDEEIDALPSERGTNRHIVRRDGACLDVSAHSMEWEGKAAYICYIQDEKTLRQSQEQLKTERDRYAHLLNAIPNGIVLYENVRSEDQQIVYFNDEICNITGYSRAEIESGAVGEVCRAVPEDKALAVAAKKAAISTMQPVEFEYRTCKKSGEMRYLRCRTTVERLPGGQMNVYAAFSDITLQKQAETALKTEYEYLATAQSRDLLAKCRANLSKNTMDSYTSTGLLEIAQSDPVYSNTVEYAAARCATNEMSALYRDSMMPERLMQAYREGKRETKVEYMRRTTEGRVLWVRTIARLREDPNTQNLLCFMYTYDIDREKTMQLVVDHITSTDFDMLGLLYVKTDLLHTVRAAALEQAMDCGEDVQYGTGMEKFIRRYAPKNAQDELRKKLSLESIRSALELKTVYTVSGALVFEGKTIYKKWEYSYLDESHEVIIFVRADITDSFEEQLRQRDALRNALAQAEDASQAKTNFLSKMSHEIRTPMNAIIGMNTLAMQVIDQPDQIRDYLSKVGISARFLLSLINDILDMSRIESGKMTIKTEKFSFDELVNSVNVLFAGQAEERGIDYDCVIASFMEDFYVGDTMKLQQILVNLLGNAIKFTGSGGKVQLIIRQERKVNGVAYMSFTVNDTGIGMSSDLQKKIFLPFEQGNATITSPYKGTGLGLAITKNLVSMMNGTIAVSSIEGVGSEFTVRLPLGVCEEEDRRNLRLSLPVENLRTLVVDDDVLICEQTKALLLDVGIQAEWVDSGVKAVEYVRQKWQHKNYFDVVLLDWKMPDMDGIETAREIRKIVGPDVTIIVMTAYDWAEIEHEAKQAGVNLLVTKPLLRSSLISVFERAYQQKEKPMPETERTEYDFLGRRVLLVEDHILNVEVAKRLLEAKGMAVDVAENGLRSIELFTEKADGYYDAILMDIRMPVMDGLTATKAIRQLRKRYAATVPIIAMSANAFDEDVEKSKAAGMNEHLSKPIEPQILYAALDKWFNKTED